MIYQAKILRLGESVEGEVMLQIGNTELTCFAYNFAIEVGSSYPVELNLFDDYTVEERPDGLEPSIVRVGNTFSYVITGRLNGRYLESGELTFEDDMLLSDFGYLDGKMVAMKVDRIDADFDLEQ
ncbi:hypothetical protein [Bordetella petrii]|uniref:hypothetical protein n=1 Tax=Bordetella petrii TaxID=94624 RepID=UPI001A9667B0|nr:hypothetical protein [Bordetella petrii]MBO1113315.1 hypothetical protein [Bordetella petrii]